MARRPSQKYGMVLKNVVIGMRASSRLPRRHPTIAPPMVPIANATSVATPTRPTVQISDSADHLGHGRACRASSEMPEVAAQEQSPVVEVLLPERRVGVEAEQCAQRLGRFGRDVAVAGEVRVDRVALHQPGQEEVDRDGRPEREQVEHGATAEEAPGDAGAALDGTRRRRARLDRIEVPCARLCRGSWGATALTSHLRGCLLRGRRTRRDRGMPRAALGCTGSADAGSRRRRDRARRRVPG